MQSQCFLMLLLTSAATAFVPLGRNAAVSTTTALRSGNPGAGLPVVEPGSMRLFDPAQEGKLSDHPEILHERLSQGYLYSPSSSTSASTSHSTAPDQVLDCQQWLEHLNENLPLNIYKPNKPGTATVLGRTRLISDDSDGDIQHIVLQLPEDFHYIEGQSLSVIPPGIDERTGKPHKPRLYSIASTRYGDLLDGKTVSLCVRLNEFINPTTQQPQKGACSDYLCNISPNEKVAIAGPVGKTMLLPLDHDRDIIMVATGTGIAPFRAFLHRLFVENTVARHMFDASAWLILGVPTTGGLLYPEEIQAMQENARPGQLEVDYAISREMTNASGGKLYVQHVLQQNADKLFEKMQNGAVIYFCGLKGMMPGILEALEEVAMQRGLDWTTTLKQWQANHQWHVEVY